MKTNSDFRSRAFTRRSSAIAMACAATVLGVLAFAQTPAPTTTSSSSPATLPGVPRFFVYMSPQGVADDAGEPSIGSNWTREATNHNFNVNGSINDIPNGGTSLYFGGFLDAMAKVTWDDCSSPAGALWENKTLLSANTPRGFGDPILFTDHDTGRTFVAQLEGLTPAGATIDITDDDGDTFTPSDGVIPSDIDHQTIGGGRYHDPLPNPGVVYPNAIYYGSQSIAEARTLRSDNGGFLFSQAATPMFTIADCSGLHGHVKVSPADGTVYVPDKGCGGDVVNFHEGSKQTLVVSVDNGITWTISEIPDSTSHGENQASHDPSVGVATDGTVYFGYQDAGGHPKIAVTHDKGATWSASYDVGANVINGGPVLNCAFPAVVAGDSDRAAFAFFGSETGGDNWHCGDGEDCTPEPPFPGVWFLYVATTFDGGQTWTTQNITPGDPIQRSGICGGGTCRNLLDFFDATIDKEGRVVVGYDDGCISTACINGDPSITAGGGQNDYTAKGVIARQGGGKRMFAAFDPNEPLVPRAPKPTGNVNVDGTATLNWPAPDNGGADITGYNIYRSDNGSAFALIATVPVNNFTDSSFAAGDVYHITAINQQGEGPFCAEVTPVVVVAPNPCATPGVLAINDLNPDGSDNDGGANTPPDPRVNVRQLFVAEPDFGRDSNGNIVEKLVFTMQLAPSADGSAPASSQWYIVWNRQGSDPSDPNDASFDRMWVGMKTDVAGALSFQFGKFGVPLDATNPNPEANTPVSFGDADSGTYDVASGVVTITISNSKLRSIDGGASKYVANTALAGINVRNYLARPDAGQKSQNNANDITNDAIYTLAGNAFCHVNRLPVASLSASPIQGTAPLTVSFDGSASTDSDGSVVSYTFSFGDGSAPVTQTSSAVQHTYSHGGNFFATLTVQDNEGGNSSNTASIAIQVVDPPPTVNVSASPTQIHEGQGATYTITVSRAVFQSVTVNYSMSGKATNGSDYTLGGTPGQVTIPGGQTSATVTLNALTDNVKEKSETAIMTLQPGSGYNLTTTTSGKGKKKKVTPPSATVTIQDGAAR